MIEAEQQFLVTKWFNKDARELIKSARELSNRGFDESVADMRRQIANAVENDQPEPMVKFTPDEGKPREVTLSEAISMMGDLRGTYFPRERQNKSFILRGEKDGHPNELHTYDAYLAENEQGFKTVQMMKRGFNEALSPIRRKQRELDKRGFKTSIVPSTTPSDTIFDVPGLFTSIDAILSQAESQLKTDEAIKENEMALIGEINKQLTSKIADIYKAKGNFSSRIKRANTIWEGYEEDMEKAFTSYARRIAAGAAKRETARNMLMSFTGRDIPFSRWKTSHPNAKYSDYRAFVKERALNPTTQKALYEDVRQYITFVLKPDTRVTRVIGYLKALAVLKFLALRVSSAAINMTNMVAAVPATLAGHSGQSITRSMGHITEAATKYAIYRAKMLGVTTGEKMPKQTGILSDADKAIFDRISELGWDEPQFNHDAAKVIQDWAGDIWNSIMSKGMYLFGATEKANRAMTIFAAYKAHQRMAKKNGVTTNAEQLFRLAKHTSDRSHGTYGKTAKPWWVQKVPPLDLLFTFQKFQQNYALNAIELGVKYGDNKNAISPAKWKNSLYMLVAPAILAGAGASIITKLLALLWPGDDPEEDFYNWVDETFGEGELASRFARHGLSGAIFGVNLRGSLQMNNPIPTEPKEMLGATGSIVEDMYNGGVHLKRGEYYKAIEDFSPTAIGSAIKGKREKEQGITTKDYAPVYYGNQPLRATGVDQIRRAFAFSPSRISAIREKQWKEDQVRREYGKRRADIKARLLHHYAQFGSTNPEGISDIFKMIDDYNERVYRSHPRYQNIYITNDWLKQSLNRAYTPKKTERLRKIN